jgi:serine/threonine-protein kinase
VTDRHPTDRPTDTAREGDSPLTLSDSSDESTLPVGSSSASGSAAAESSGASGESTETGDVASESATGSGGGTTGGFETLLGKLVVRSGLVTKNELDECQEHIDNATQGGPPQTLPDVLIDRDYLTRHQLERLRQDFEAKKSGQHIPGYKITRKLGSGAMATVFLARQLSLDRLVAIKILPKKFSGNVKFIERFYKEGRSAAQLNHPNIVSAYDVGRGGDHHYFVMEYVDGTTIHDRILKRQRISEKEALEIVQQVAKALQHAHSRGFVHRDIKPKNIMVTRSGVVKLADLGLARAMSDEEAAKAEAGRAYGTPYYISPEQIRGEVNIGPAADIYGLGATLYHMVTGRVPFEGKNPSAVMHKHLKAQLQPPDHVNAELSAGCAQIIEMMMAKKPEERYHDAKDLLEDVELVLGGEPPHFAHRTLDQEMMTDALTDVVEAPASIRRLDSAREKPVSESTMFVVLVAIAAISVLVNIILLTVVFS